MTNLSTQACVDVRAVRPILDQVANKWTLLILTVLCPQPARFNAIMRRLDGITHKSLADALKRLERDGLVTRQVLPTAPVGVEYTITPLGLSLQAPFDALYGWALEHGGKLQAAQSAYDRSRDGHGTVSAQVVSFPDGSR